MPEQSSSSLRQNAHRLLGTFEGRTDAWGGDEGRAIWQPVTVELIEGHLRGDTPCGVYPIRQRNDDADPLVVRWGCCDIDTGDWNEAYRLGYALEGMGMLPWVERSRSKGWHIWVFAEDWVEAWEMRRALKVAYSTIGLPAKEANPKSERLRANQLGNYVRLPYKGWYAGSQERQVMLKDFDRHHDGQVMSLDEFLDSPKGVSVETIKHWAGKWYEAPRQTHVSADDLLADAEIATLAARMNPRTRGVWQDGPKTADRSATLQALAYTLRNQGFNAQENYQLVNAADRMWGKYHLRVDGNAYIADIVERAYA